ncbi:MAG: ribonuclease H family protein [Bacteroidales bacterium]|nr:ribonuclease H family protein [Bacteroidales bacterium]
MPKQKFYVVWRGRKPGVYDNWDGCKAQVEGFGEAAYKAYATLEDAEEAFWRGKEEAQPAQAVAGQDDKTSGTPLPTAAPRPYDEDAIAVDAACSGNPGPMEYRGVDLRSGRELFHLGPLHGTNNIGEFLAIVHALALLKKQGVKRTVYSDSRNALLWVRQKQCKTRLERNAQTEGLFQLIDRAVIWLRNNKIEVPLLKWQTKEWGEVPADFGRK